MYTDWTDILLAVFVIICIVAWWVTEIAGLFT